MEVKHGRLDSATPGARGGSAEASRPRGKAEAYPGDCEAGYRSETESRGLTSRVGRV